MDKVKDEAKNNPIEQPVTFTKDPTSLLTESDDKSKTANLADLKSEADTLKISSKRIRRYPVLSVLIQCRKSSSSIQRLKKPSMIT